MNLFIRCARHRYATVHLYVCYYYTGNATAVDGGAAAYFPSANVTASSTIISANIGSSSSSTSATTTTTADTTTTTYQWRACAGGEGALRHSLDASILGGPVPLGKSARAIRMSRM